MYSKLFILFALFVFPSNGVPLEVSRNNEDVSLSPRIVGGEDAPPGAAKHMVALIFHIVGWSPSFICGGSIISKKHVLSAAHCIEPYVIWGKLLPSFKGVIGSNYWNSTKNRLEFTHFKIHPEWNLRTIKNDIGFLVTNDIVLNERTAVIPLSFDFIGGGVDSFVTGWGRLGNWQGIPDRLQILDLNTISSKQCAAAIDDVSAGIGNAKPFDPDQEICTLHSVHHGLCYGDSGSALVIKETGEQIGIVSWGFPCAQGHPDMYARVSAFKDFLGEIF